MGAISEKGFSVKLSANTSQYEMAMARAKGATVDMAQTSGRNLQKLGTQTSQLGGLVTKNLGAPLAIAGGIAIKMSADFESSFARMEGLAGVTAGEVDGLKAAVLDLAGRTAQAPQELANALYEASSAGLDTAGALAAVQVAAKGAAVGMGSAQDIVGLVASATASYGKANITAAAATDILTASIKAGRADPSELAGSLGRILPIASKLGVSFDQVGGATAFLSNIMGNTAETVTALQGFFVQLLSPTQQGKQALIDMGTSVADLHAAISQNGLMGALDLLRSKGFAANQDALRNLFPDVQAFQGALALISDTSGALSGTLDATANSTGSLDSAFALAADTSGFKMKQAFTEIKVALIQAGDVIMPVVSGIAGAVGRLAEAFIGLPKPVQEIILGLGALVIAAGPVLIIAGSLIKNFKLMQSTFSTVSKHISDEMGLLAVGAVAALYLLNQHLDNLAKTRAFDTARVDLFVQALKDGKSAAEAWDTAISKTGKLEFIDAGSFVADTKDATGALARMGLTFDDLKAHLGGSRDEFEKWAFAQSSFGKAGTKEKANDLNTVIQAGTQLIGQYTTATQQAADSTSTYGAALEGERHGLEYTVMATQDLVTAKSDLAAIPPPSAEEVAAIKAVTDAVTTQVKAYEDDLTAQQALVDFARGAADAQYALATSTDAYNKFLEDLPGKLKEINKSKDSEAEKLRQINALYRDGSKAAGTLADDVVTAYDDAANGALNAREKGDLWRNSMLSSAAAAAGPVRQSILDYVLAVNKVPDEKKTAIIAAVEAGDLTAAVALLDGASETRKVEIQADVDQKAIDLAKGKLNTLKDPLHAMLVVDADVTGAMAKMRLLLGRAGSFHASANGRYVDHPMISTLGEGGLPEVVLPLTNQGRMVDLLSDKRVSGPILGALGGTMRSAAGRVVNLTHMSVPSLTSSSSVATVADASGPTADEVNAEQDKLQERMFHRDAISYEQYRAYLAKRKQGLAEYSDEEQMLFDKIQQLDQNETAARERDAKIQTDMADRIHKYQADTNQLSLEDYKAYLEGRRASFQVYTDGWFALTAQITDAQRQMDQAAQTATKSVYNQADAVKALADAKQANIEADAAFNDAGATVTKTAKGGSQSDRDAAAADYQRTAVALAQSAYNLADALAISNGYVGGSIEWARFMRQRLTADSVWNHANGRDNVANAVDRLLLGIPAFAAGGYVPATPGGKVVRVAEAGQGEWMIPANRMHAMAGGGGGQVYAPVYHISITGAIDRPGVARELREILGEHDRRNGLN